MMPAIQTPAATLSCEPDSPCVSAVCCSRLPRFCCSCWSSAWPRRRPSRSSARGPVLPPAGRPAGTGRAPSRSTSPRAPSSPSPSPSPSSWATIPRFALEVSDVVAADLERSGLFQPLDRASFIDQPARHQRPAALPGLARPQRPGAGGRQGLPRARRPPGRRVPPVGRLLGPPARGPALRRRAARLAPARPPRRRPGLPAPDAARRAISTPRWCSSTRPAPRTGATSGSP